ncbi:aspartate dehydrogenase [Sphingopyxis terrae]|uniref:aspartate dehydrogenase n=1 Tax=Sphingopyxis terrae TaxID=33052 RepID=UPI002A0BB77D|nr:aspartate dehydrogenase [Sphingopyxis terrae]MDX8356478.1 aspartate dehydrogenase [Sphingopyxis terrae]
MIGYGAMGRSLQASLARSGDRFKIAAALVPAESRSEPPAGGSVRIFHDVSELIAWRPSLVVECAGHAAVRDAVPHVLRAGIDVVIVSIGSLSDAKLLGDLEAAAIAGDSRLIVASGAVGGLDALRAAKRAGLTSVAYLGCKPPAAWQGSAAESLCDLSEITTRTVFFEGTAEEAARRFPKNANVAAAIALAGIGFDRTKVSLAADPAITCNSHNVTAQGAFGEFSITLHNNSLPDNPKTSLLAAMSMEESIVRHFTPLEL